MASCFFVSEPSVDDPGDAGLGVVAAAWGRCFFRRPRFFGREARGFAGAP